MNSAAAALENESLAWAQLLDLLNSHLAGSYGDLPAFIFLASSAGGVYGGNLDGLLTERTPPRPNSDYGLHKLRMEEALRTWAAAFPNASCLIGRISSLYGPQQDPHKIQGIISHISRCLIYRQAANIYVPLDTRRDYLFVDDCADQIAECLARSLAEQPGIIVKIFASEETTNLSRIVGVFFRIAKHRPLIISRQAHGTQSISLKLRSEVWNDLGLRKTDLTTGIHLVHEHQLGLFRQGILPRPQ
jgi:UDP-glucose 4-epimerase